MPNPQALLQPARRVIYLLAALGVVYLIWRFELVRLPNEGCSPLLRVGAGDLLWFDQRPSQLGEGDVVLFEGPGGALLLGEIRADDEADRPKVPGAFWIRTDRPDCPGFDSVELGWIPRERVHGRMLLATGQF